MPYILSPEQKVVATALLCNETSSTKYFDIISAMQSICKASTEVLGEGKKILIQIPDVQMRNLLKSMFEANGLDDLTIDLSDRGAMPEIDIIKLRSTLKKNKNTDAIINHVLSKKKQSALNAQVSEFYEALDSKVMSDIPFRDFVTNSIYKKKTIYDIPLINSISDDRLQFSASEYYSVKKEINQAIEIYLRQYDLYDYLSLFKEDLWEGITEDSITKINAQLNEFKQEIGNLLDDFKSATKALFDDSTQELSNTFSSLENKFDSHEEACIAYQIKSTSEAGSKEGLFSIFKKKKTQTSNQIYVDAFDELSSLIQSISQEWYDELDAPTAEMINYDYIQNFINSNRTKASAYKAKINKNLQSTVQRINKINTSSPVVISLDQRLETFIQKMNASELFDLNLEHNILSFLKQMELCENIADYIEKCNILANSSSSYLKWKSFYSNSGEIFRRIFIEIKKLPKNTWIELFEHWYEYQVHNQVLSNKSISSDEMGRFYAQAKTTIQVEVSALIANLHSQRIEGANLLKETTKELHNTLFKKKQLPNTSWYNTALMNRPFMQSFFPIHISDSSAYAAEYDVVISFSKGEEDRKSNIHYFSPIESKDIQNMSEKKDNFLYLNDYNYNTTLAQLSSTDKLKAAKKLAKYILSLNQNIKIYQLKNANIISLLPAHDDSFLEQELDKVNVKVIDTNGVLYDRLTESILFTDRQPFLIIKDELINSELHEHALWQLKMIYLFRDVGYEIISLNTTDQLQDNVGQFDKILQKISGLKTNTNVEIKANQVQKSSEMETVPEEV